MIKFNLEDLAGGQLGIQFEAEAKKVINNLLDPNTPFKNKRGITIKLTFEQNEERNDVIVSAQVESKLSPRSQIKTNMAIGKDLRTNELYVEEYGKGIRGQMELKDYPIDNSGNIMIDDKTINSETGEIVARKS